MALYTFSTYAQELVRCCFYLSGKFRIVHVQSELTDAGESPQAVYHRAQDKIQPKT